MDLYRDILVEALSKQNITITFENLETESPCEIVKNACYVTLEKIRETLDNNELDDFECIERIVKLLENVGIGGGTRHDF